MEYNHVPGHSRSSDGQFYEDLLRKIIGWEFSGNPPDPPDTAEAQFGTSLPHAPGTRMTVVNQLPQITSLRVIKKLLRGVDEGVDGF